MKNDGSFDKLNKLKVELYRYGIEHKCDIIHIIEKYRKAFATEDGQKQHKEEIDWEESPMAHREVWESSWTETCKKLGYPPPTSFGLGRSRELFEKGCKEDKARKILMAQRKQNELMAKDAHLPKTDGPNEQGLVNDNEPKENDVVKVIDKRKKNELTEQEEVVKAQYIKKLIRVKNTKEYWETAQEERRKGNKMVWFKAFNDAKYDFVNFKTENRDSLESIKKKLRAKGEKLPSESTQTQREKQTAEFYRQKALKKDEPQPGSAEYLLQKRMKELEQERAEMRMKKRQKEQEKEMGNVQITKTNDDLFDYANGLGNKNKVKLVKSDDPPKEIVNADKKKEKFIPKSVRKKAGKIAKKIIPGLESKDKIKPKYINVHDGGNDEEVEISVAQKALNRMDKKNGFALAQSVDYYDHLYDVDMNGNIDGYIVNEEYKNPNTFGHEMNLDMMMIGFGVLFVALLLFCSCAVIGAVVGYFVWKRQMRMYKSTELDIS